MPISQDRFMNVITYAKKLGKAFDQISRLNKATLSELVANANSAIGKVDPVTSGLISDLLGHINTIKTVLEEADDKYMAAVVLAEDMHFRKVGKRNDRQANYQRAMRMQQGMTPRGREIYPAPPQEGTWKTPEEGYQDHSRAYQTKFQQDQIEYIKDRLREYKDKGHGELALAHMLQVQYGDNIPGELVLALGRMFREQPDNIISAAQPPMESTSPDASLAPGQATPTNAMRQLKDGTLVDLPTDEELANRGTIPAGQNIF